VATPSKSPFSWEPSLLALPHHHRHYGNASWWDYRRPSILMIGAGTRAIAKRDL